LRKQRILIVDDDHDILTSLSGLLKDKGYSTLTASTAEAAFEIIESQSLSLVLLDVVMPETDGIEALRRIKTNHPDLPVVMISGAATIDVAVTAIKLGATDFVEKPFDPVDRLLVTIENALKMNELRRENIELRAELGKHRRMIGESEPMKKLRVEIAKAAPSSARVLITGENGTGKELVAAAIHENSPRRDGPFIKVNCAAIPKDLIESELFGYEKGAFTGAVSAKEGKFELADGGTLLLDEIGDMSLEIQAKLLRVLEEQEVERVGAKQPRKVDVRVISSTNKELAAEIRRGNFREDLYFRISVIPIHVPPLRQRKDDIALLARYFIEMFCEENNRAVKELTSGAIEALMAYDWPGNVRELKNVIERLVIMVDTPTISDRHVRDILKQHEGIPGEGTLSERIEAYEKSLILSTLRDVNWNISRAASKLGIDRANLHRKLRRYGIERPETA